LGNKISFSEESKAKISNQGEIDRKAEIFLEASMQLTFGVVIILVILSHFWSI
jgi:hypothetical protein